MIIDFSAHIIPPEVGKILMKKPFFGPISGKYHYTYPPESADPKVRLKLMEKYCIDMQLLSQTTPVLLGFDPDEAAKICTLSNNCISELCNAYPDKFIGCAIISLLDITKALEELDRTVGELGFKCITVSTNQNQKGLESPEYIPFYERVVKYDVPIFLHPTDWDGYPLADLEKGWRMMQIFGWPFDTTQAVWRLIYGGIFDKFPTLKIVTHHLGGMLPFFNSRAIVYSHRVEKKLQKPLTSYFEQVYADTALTGGPLGSLICGYAFFGPDRMLFGTDYPFGDDSIIIGENLAGIKAMPIPKLEKEKILGENAKKLLKITF